MTLNLPNCFRKCVITLGLLGTRSEFPVFQGSIRGDGYRLARSVAPESTVAYLETVSLRVPGKGNFGSFLQPNPSNRKADSATSSR